MARPPRLAWMALFKFLIKTKEIKMDWMIRHFGLAGTASILAFVAGCAIYAVVALLGIMTPWMAFGSACGTGLGTGIGVKLAEWFA